MLSTFLIGLREGLEGALIVSILVAYVIRTDRRELLTPIWFGVGVALAGSFGFGAFLAFTSAELSPHGEELFAGITSLLAVGFVTWMVFWMKRAARGLRENLENKIEDAHTIGKLALVSAAFFAIAREGLETALFVYSNFQTVSANSAPTVGLILGLGLAVLLGYLIYKGAVVLDLKKFFTFTGIALVIVAAGVLSYGVHELQEFGLLPGVDAFVWDITSWMPKGSIVATLLAGTIGFDTTTSWLQLVFYAGYLGLVIPAFLKVPRASSIRR